MCRWAVGHLWSVSLVTFGQIRCVSSPLVRFVVFRWSPVVRCAIGPLVTFGQIRLCTQVPVEAHVVRLQVSSRAVRASSEHGA